MTTMIDVMADDDFVPSDAKDQDGVGTAWRRYISMDAERGVGVMIWKADTGHYISAHPPYAETFVVLSGTADCAIGDGEFVPIGPGAIVHMPLGAGLRLKIKTPYRMVATAIMGHAPSA
jgi:mannose-6-phosphate isomerase-like protein (cupin superfamily)